MFQTKPFLNLSDNKKLEARYNVQKWLASQSDTTDNLRQNSYNPQGSQLTSATQWFHRGTCSAASALMPIVRNSFFLLLKFRLHRSVFIAIGGPSSFCAWAYLFHRTWDLSSEFTNQGLNLRPLHQKADSWPLDHQGGPSSPFLLSLPSFYFLLIYICPLSPSLSSVSNPCPALTGLSHHSCMTNMRQITQSLRSCVPWHPLYTYFPFSHSFIASHFFFKG